jgi:phosphate transport system substrate-binding protein
MKQTLFAKLKGYHFAAGCLAVLAMGASSTTVLLKYAPPAVDITGAGSTFVYPVMSKWAESFNGKTGNRVNYQAIGSGGGIAQIKASTVTFGATDMPMKPGDLKAAGLAQFPIVIGGVVPVVNLDTIGPGQIKFSGPLLADIYLGKVKRWNHPAIVALNPGLALTDQPITVVHRSDGSGTTFNWVNYLSKVSDDWRTKVGEGIAVKWPTGVGGKGNEGVAAYVNQTRGSIGYVELAYATKHKMSYAAVRNKAGNFVEPSAQTFLAAASSVDWASTEDFYQVITDVAGEESWPITATVFVEMYRNPKDESRSKEALDFFKWAFENGQADATFYQYIPLPPALTRQVETYWAMSIK